MFVKKKIKENKRVIEYQFLIFKGQNLTEFAKIHMPKSMNYYYYYFLKKIDILENLIEFSRNF
jgi:hypothetical protein